MSYRNLAGRVHGYTPHERMTQYGYMVEGSNGARTVRTTMPKGRFLSMSQKARDEWLRTARRWVEDQLR